MFFQNVQTKLIMTVGTQYSGTVVRNGSLRLFTWGWNPALHVLWHAMAVSPRPGAAQIEWEIEVERANATQTTYWITVKNLTNFDVQFDLRYAILN